MENADLVTFTKGMLIGHFAGNKKGSQKVSTYSSYYFPKKVTGGLFIYWKN